MPEWLQRVTVWKRTWWVCLGVFLIVSAWARVSAVLGTAPYSQHVDEVHLTRTAVNMLKTGDPNPHFFKYPSLPIYLTALSMRLANAGRAGGPSSWQIPTKGGPYEPPAGFVAARVLFALMSIVTLGLCGMIARSVFESDAALLVAPLVLSASHVFRTSGAGYLNVDIVNALFLTAALAASFSFWGRDTIALTALLPGLLVGLSAASKYTGGVALLPCALSILLGQKERRPSKVLVLGAAAAAAFVLAVPYSVLDRATFVADVRWEIHHYKTGHLRFDGPPGIPQLLYYMGELLRDYRAPALWLGLLGLVAGLVRDPRRTLTLASLPVGLLLHMCTNRVHFVRTVLPVFALTPVFVSGAIAEVARGTGRVAARLRSKVGTPGPSFLSATPGIVGAAAFASLWLTLDRSAVLDRDLRRDTRNVAVAWLREHAGDHTVLVASDLRVAPSRLQGLRAQGVKVQSIAPDLADLPGLAAGARTPLYVVTPRYRPALPVIGLVGGRRVILPGPPDPVKALLIPLGARSRLELPGELTPRGPGWQEISPVLLPALAIHEVSRR